MSEVLSMGKPWDLARAWQRLRAEEPGVRAREAARKLCTSEAELVASGCGTSAVRLDRNFGALVAGVSSLGDVMALTRNEHAVHEKTGRYENLQIGAVFGLVLGPEIDLRLFLQRWRYGFAVTETGRHGTRQSLQFFGAHGTALHKVYLTVFIVVHESTGRADRGLAQGQREIMARVAVSADTLGPLPGQRPTVRTRRWSVRSRRPPRSRPPRAR